MTIPRLGPRLDPGVVTEAATLLPPVAGFTHSVTGQSVEFSDTSIDPDGVIVSWEWDFGVGGPAAAFSFVVAVRSVTFTDQSVPLAPATIASRLWDFGDGTTSTATNPVHNYLADGTYNVRLTVTDSNGAPGVSQELVHIGAVGVPFGPFNLFDSLTGPPVVSGFTSTLIPVDPGNIIEIIANLRARGMKGCILLMTSGSKPYVTASGVFDPAKWKARMDLFNTAAIKKAVADGFNDGTLGGHSMVDEPNRNSPDPTRGWGGYFTKARVDALAVYAKNIFPTLPAGVLVEHEWRTAERYTVLDFIISQTWKNSTDWAAGPDAFVLEGQHQADLNGIAIAYSLNLYAGPNDANPCIVPPSGDFCALSAALTELWGKVLGRNGAALFMWRYHSQIWARLDMLAAFDAIAEDLADRPRKSLKATRSP